MLKNTALAQDLFASTVLQGLSWQAFFLNNLIPVTIGNIIGGVVFVAIAYWTCYLRPLVPRDLSVKARVHG